MVKIKPDKPEPAKPEPAAEPAKTGDAAQEVQAEKAPELPKAPPLKAEREKLAEEAEDFCADLERFFRRAFGEIPKAVELGEVRAQQATVRDMVRRAGALGGDANEKLGALTAEREQMREAATRARADFLNYQSRSQKDLQRAEELALRNYVADVLPILDSLELALKDATGEKAEVKRLREALDLVERSLRQVLTVRGLERIEAAGKPFDPNIHEAVAKRAVDPAKGEKPNLVLEELRAGYLWQGRVLRAVQVLVSDAEKPEGVPPA